mmetsp:Transcript_15652/g.39839  ORF Transcript_15652/g.39839 Transcript_15652/m.39839 type:complete len:200 (+) Transcript_15652:1557-2156(+)
MRFRPNAIARGCTCRSRNTRGPHGTSARILNAESDAARVRGASAIPGARSEQPPPNRTRAQLLSKKPAAPPRRSRSTHRHRPHRLVLRGSARQHRQDAVQQLQGRVRAGVGLSRRRRARRPALLGWPGRCARPRGKMLGSSSTRADRARLPAAASAGPGGRRPVAVAGARMNRCLLPSFAAPSASAAAGCQTGPALAAA